MDFLAKLPNGHSLKPDKPTVAHSLGLAPSSHLSPGSPARSNKPLNFHYAQQQQQHFAQPIQTPRSYQQPQHVVDSPWVTSNKHYGLHVSGQNGGIGGIGGIGGVHPRSQRALSPPPQQFMQKIGGNFGQQSQMFHQQNQNGPSVYHSQAQLPTMQSLQLQQQADNRGNIGGPFNIRMGAAGAVASNDPSLIPVGQAANNKILYEDPLERKRRERQQKIDQERAEMAVMSDPFAQLGQSGNNRAIQRKGSSHTIAPPPPQNPLQSAGLALIQQNSYNTNGGSALFPPPAAQPPITHTIQTQRTFTQKAGPVGLNNYFSNNNETSQQTFGGGAGAGQQFFSSGAQQTAGFQSIGAMHQPPPMSARAAAKVNLADQFVRGPSSAAPVSSGLHNRQPTSGSMLGSPQRPLRQHQISSIAIAKSDDEIRHQQFQGQKVTNLESADQMTERLNKMEIQKQILEQQMAEKRARDAAEKEKEREQEYKLEQKLKQEEAQNRLNEQQQHEQQANDHQRQRSPPIHHLNKGSASPMGNSPPRQSSVDDLAPPRALTQKEKNLLHAKQGRLRNAAGGTQEQTEQVQQQHNNNNNYQMPYSSAARVAGDEAITTKLPRRRSYDSIDQREVGFSSPKIGSSVRRHLPPITMSSVGSFPGGVGGMGVDTHPGDLSMQQRGLLGRPRSNESTKRVIGQIKDQFKEELDRFKDEIVGHKEDVHKFLDQLKEDAKKTIEIRQSAELQAVQLAAMRDRNLVGVEPPALFNEQQQYPLPQHQPLNQKQIMSARGALSAQRILEYKAHDQRRFEYLRRQQQSAAAAPLAIGAPSSPLAIEYSSATHANPHGQKSPVNHTPSQKPTNQKQFNSSAKSGQNEQSRELPSHNQFQQIHEDVQSSNQNVGEFRQTTSRQPSHIGDTVDPLPPPLTAQNANGNNKNELNDTSMSLVAETQFIKATDNPDRQMLLHQHNLVQAKQLNQQPNFIQTIPRQPPPLASESIQLQIVENMLNKPSSPPLQLDIDVPFMTQPPDPLTRLNLNSAESALISVPSVPTEPSIPTQISAPPLNINRLDFGLVNKKDSSPSVMTIETIRRKRRFEHRPMGSAADEQEPAELDGETLEQLQEIDDQIRGAQSSLQELKGKSQGIYSLPTTSALPVMPNEQKYDGMWRQAMKEPLPLYFNADGTRTNAVKTSRENSPVGVKLPAAPAEDFQTRSAQSIVEIAGPAQSDEAIPDYLSQAASINRPHVQQEEQKSVSEAPLGDIIRVYRTQQEVTQRTPQKQENNSFQQIDTVSRHSPPREMIVTTGPPRDGSSPRSRKSHMINNRDTSTERRRFAQDEAINAETTPHKSMNHTRSRSRIHSTYLEKMSDYKDKELAEELQDQVNKSQDRKNHSPMTGKSMRKMYHDVKKELDVGRIEDLMKEVSPATNKEGADAAASSSADVNTSHANKTEMRRLLESMKKSARDIDTASQNIYRQDLATLSQINDKGRKEDTRNKIKQGATKSNIHRRESQLESSPLIERMSNRRKVQRGDTETSFGNRHKRQVDADLQGKDGGVSRGYSGAATAIEQRQQLATRQQ